MPFLLLQRDSVDVWSGSGWEKMGRSSCSGRISTKCSSHYHIRPLRLAFQRARGLMLTLLIMNGIWNFFQWPGFCGDENWCRGGSQTCETRCWNSRDELSSSQSNNVSTKVRHNCTTSECKRLTKTRCSMLRRVKEAHSQGWHTGICRVGDH